MDMEAEFNRLEWELSFLQIRATIALQETICHVKAEICENCKQIVHTNLESIWVQRTCIASYRFLGGSTRSLAMG
jgi:hypothetical protein